ARERIHAARVQPTAPANFQERASPAREPRHARSPARGRAVLHEQALLGRSERARGTPAARARRSRAPLRVVPRAAPADGLDSRLPALRARRARRAARVRVVEDARVSAIFSQLGDGVLALAQLAQLVALAPLLQGVVKKTKAFLQGRRGPPVLQP